MSHQSGITGNRKSLVQYSLNFLCLFLATELLREKFAEMKDGHIRVVVVVIENGLNLNFISIGTSFVLEKLVSKGEHNAERAFNEGNRRKNIN